MDEEISSCIGGWTSFLSLTHSTRDFEIISQYFYYQSAAFDWPFLLRLMGYLGSPLSVIGMDTYCILNIIQILAGTVNYEFDNN